MRVSEEALDAMQHVHYCETLAAAHAVARDIFTEEALCALILPLCGDRAEKGRPPPRADGTAKTFLTWE